MKGAQKINNKYKNKDPDEYAAIAKKYSKLFDTPEKEYEETLDFNSKNVIIITKEEKTGNSEEFDEISSNEDDKKSVRTDLTEVDKGDYNEDEDYEYHKEATRIFTFGIDSRVNEEKIKTVLNIIRNKNHPKLTKLKLINLLKVKKKMIYSKNYKGWTDK